MKRISSWPRRGSARAGLRLRGLIVLLAFTPGVTNGWYYGSYEGVHYSPYALNYYGSGLIPGYVQYSPYALSYQSSGLIDEFAQYTPYVLSYYNSGLVQDYGIYPGYATTFVFPVHPFRHGVRAPLMHRAPSVVRRHAQVPPPAARKQDGIDIIRRQLGTKGFASPCIDRILRVDNQLVSVDFLVRDRNVLIKYWNPQELERLSTTGGYKQKACAKYKEDWERYARQYRQAGGEIYTISASEPESIVAALDSCTHLGPSQDGTSRPVLYAQAHPGEIPNLKYQTPNKSQ